MHIMNISFESEFTRLQRWAEDNLENALVEIDHRERLGAQTEFIFEDGNILLQAKKAESEAVIIAEINLCISFPFPIEVRSLEFDTALLKGYHLSLYLHLDPIHELLRNKLIEELHSLGGFETSFEVVTIAEFWALVSESLRSEYELIYYHDPFRFAGDSVFHLRNLDCFAGQLDFEDKVATTSHKVVDGYRDLHYVIDPVKSELVSERIANRNVFAILPNYIDDQWENTIALTRFLVKSCKSAVIVIPCRNLHIQSEHNKVVRIVHLTGRDITLWDFPNEEMLNNALSKFVQPTQESSSRLGIQEEKRNSRIIYIHPFTSARHKDIPPEFASIIANELNKLNEQGANLEIVVCGGFVGSRYHEEWRNEYMNLTSPNTNFYFLGPFTEMASLVANCSFLVSADTVTTHLAEYSNTPAITIYNRTSWDKYSWGSLLHHSPIGFGYNSPLRFPLVIGGESSTEFTSLEHLVYSVRKCIALVLGLEKVDAIQERALANVNRVFRVSMKSKPELMNMKDISILRSNLVENGRSTPVFYDILTAWLPFEDLEIAASGEKLSISQIDTLTRKFLNLNPLYKLSEIVKKAGDPMSHSD